jgi:hypothetical protein
MAYRAQVNKRDAHYHKYDDQQMDDYDGVGEHGLHGCATTNVLGSVLLPQQGLDVPMDQHGDIGLDPRSPL